MAYQKGVYTEKQLQIINGEISLDSVNGRTALALYKKASINGDDELAARAKDRVAKAKEIAKENNRIRTNNRSHNKKENPHNWKQPKSSEYTEHQKQIVRGEIPLDKVHTKELIHIHLKAKAAGDYELSERILDLIDDRRKAAEVNNQNRLVALKQREAEKRFDHLETSDTNRFTLTAWEQGVVDVTIDLDECSLEKLQQIYEIVKKGGDKDVVFRVEKLLLIKEHPETLYLTQDHKKAVDIIEEQLQLPIRRPNTWFA